jgi:hypothetical protein
MDATDGIASIEVGKGCGRPSGPDGSRARRTSASPPHRAAIEVPPHPARRSSRSTQWSTVRWSRRVAPLPPGSAPAAAHGRRRRVLATSALASAGRGLMRSAARLPAPRCGDRYGRAKAPKSGPDNRTAARTACTAIARLAGHAAAARVHCRDQLDSRRIGDAMIGTRDHAFAPFQAAGAARRASGARIPEIHRGREHRCARAKPLPAHAKAAADDCRHRGRMMRRARTGRRSDSLPPESWPAMEGSSRLRAVPSAPAAAGWKAGAAASMDFPESGRPDHHQIVTTGSGHFQRALGALLSLDVGKVGQVGRPRMDARLRPRQHLRSTEMIGDARSGFAAPVYRSPSRPMRLPRPDAAGQISPLPSAFAPIAAGSAPATGGDRAVKRSVRQ